MANRLILSIGKVDEEILLLSIIIQRHYKEITFDIIRIAIYYIILGIP